jgi:methionyl-tRNA synthetase
MRGYENRIAERLERAELRDAFRLIFELSSFANKTFQDGEPWKNRAANPPAAEALIRDLCYAVRDIAVMIEPYMPAAAERILSFFGLGFARKGGFVSRILPAKGLSWEDIGLEKGLHRVLKNEVLFAKLEDEQIAELRDRYSGSQKERKEQPEKPRDGQNLEARAAGDERKNSGSAKAAPGTVPPGDAAPVKRDFAGALDLRAAKIVKIERHPKADKLYIETLEIKNSEGVLEERIIVSGLVPFYKEEELLGKRILVAYNLKAAKLRGVESRGMLLAASDRLGPDGAERVEVLDAGDAPVGSRVVLEGDEPPAADLPEISIDDFFSVPLTVKDSRVEAEGRLLTLGGKPIVTRIVSSGEVH